MLLRASTYDGCNASWLVRRGLPVAVEQMSIRSAGAGVLAGPRVHLHLAQILKRQGTLLVHIVVQY